MLVLWRVLFLCCTCHLRGRPFSLISAGSWRKRRSPMPSNVALPWRSSVFLQRHLGSATTGDPIENDRTSLVQEVVGKIYWSWLRDYFKISSCCILRVHGGKVVGVFCLFLLFGRIFGVSGFVSTSELCFNNRCILQIGGFSATHS